MWSLTILCRCVIMWLDKGTQISSNSLWITSAKEPQITTRFLGLPKHLLNTLPHEYSFMNKTGINFQLSFHKILLPESL